MQYGAYRGEESQRAGKGCWPSGSRIFTVTSRIGVPVSTIVETGTRVAERTNALLRYVTIPHT